MRTWQKFCSPTATTVNYTFEFIIYVGITTLDDTYPFVRRYLSYPGTDFALTAFIYNTPLRIKLCRCEECFPRSDFSR